MSVPEKEMTRTIRVSLGRGNRPEELDRVVETMEKAVSEIRSKSGFSTEVTSK